MIDAARTNAEHIGRERASHFAAVGVKPAPDAKSLAAVVLADARALEIAQEALAKADKVLADELQDDAEPLAERDARAEKVREHLVAFRSVLTAVCGEVAVRSVGFVGETPRDASALHALGAAVIDAVAKKPPKASVKGVKFSAPESLAGLDAELAALDVALKDVGREKREEQQARALRDKAWEAFEREYKLVTANLECALRSAGLGDVADRLRPAVASAAEKTPTPTPDAPRPTP